MENWKTRLLKARQIKEMSQERLAKASGVTQNAISGWEQQDASKKNYIEMPKSQLLAKVAKALGTTSDWILTGRGEMGASQSMGIDLSTLESAIVSVKKALRARQLELDAFVAAPLIAYAYRERVNYPSIMSKDEYQAFDAQIETKLLGEIGHGRTVEQGARSSEKTASAEKKIRTGRK